MIWSEVVWQRGILRPNLKMQGITLSEKGNTLGILWSGCASTFPGK